MAGRVKTQTFAPGGGIQENNNFSRKKGNEKLQDKNELTFQRAFQQVIFAIILNLASSGMI